jgi:hypothetical protein
MVALSVITIPETSSCTPQSEVRLIDTGSRRIDVLILGRIDRTVFLFTRGAWPLIELVVVDTKLPALGTTWYIFPGGVTTNEGSGAPVFWELDDILVVINGLEDPDPGVLTTAADPRVDCVNIGAVVAIGELAVVAGMAFE